MKPPLKTRLLKANVLEAALFGGYTLTTVRQFQCQFRGGQAVEGTAAREWCSSHHETAFASAPLKLVDGQPEPTPRGSCKRVLVVDDDPLVRGSLAAVLEYEGYEVDEARNGIEAITRSIEHEPSLVLLDLNMPHWDGWTAFSQLDRVTPLLPVIIITARPNQYEKAVRLGVDAFMEKPLNIPILVGAIRRLIAEDRNRRVGRITHRGFVTERLGSAGP